jgi:Uma2 family endonuclease
MEAWMSAATSPDWTYAEYASLPDDGNRHEVLDGEILTTPSPGATHQRVARNLFVKLHEYVTAHGCGECLWELDVLFAPGQFLCPDIVYVANGERHRITERGVEGRPGLVVEIVSPGSRRIDRVTKPARYGDLGVPEYWAVDPETRTITVWDYSRSPEPRVEAERLAWLPVAGVAPLVMELTSIFGPVW